VTTLILARHGETDWNRDGRWQGHADQPLNAAGRAQAKELADELRDEPIAAVYASDLARARETADIVAAPRGLLVRTDRRLREVDIGGWSGLTLAEVEARYPETVARWRAGDPAHSFEAGETYAAMGERVAEALREIARRHPGEQVLVVLHGGPIRAVLAHEAGISYEEQRHRREHLENCGLVRIAVEGGTFRGLD
jgi:probable phosphoglycerate mutase